MLFVAVPSAPPVITNVTALNSTSVLVEWERVPKQERNGIIIEYTIQYMDVDKRRENIKTVPAPALHVTISGLRQKAKYSFRIKAATSKGNGSLFSESKSTTTHGKENIESYLIAMRAIHLRSRCYVIKVSIISDNLIERLVPLKIQRLLS